MPAPAPLVLAGPARVALLAGELLVNRLRARPGARVILPTGRTPLAMYAVLRAHATDGSLSGTRPTVFQLDEYQGLSRDDPRSYAAYLRRELHGVPLARLHELDGAAADVAAECRRHQALIDAAPIDLAVLGIGRDGHVAFDEPGSDPSAGVRRVRLHPLTRTDAAAGFGGLDAVPREALTVGLGTLRAAREVLLIATGAAKADALQAMLEGERGPASPASWLRDHPRLTIVCDGDAARLLRPWPGRASDRAVIVLGHREPGRSAEETPSEESRARLARAERLCAADPPPAVIFTGWSRTRGGLSEAEQMKAEWPDVGVPVLLEDAGRNTAENATCSLPLVRAIGGIRRVTVVTSVWHVRAPYFFAPYRALGLRLGFAPEFDGPWLRQLGGELRALRRAPAQRRDALARMRLPPAEAGPPWRPG